jgi:hypothetical protein
MQEPQPLGHNFTEEKIDPGRVAAGPGEVRGKTHLHWVFGDATTGFSSAGVKAERSGPHRSRRRALYKNLWSERCSAQRPELVSVRDESDQARYIVEKGKTARPAPHSNRRLFCSAPRITAGRLCANAMPILRWSFLLPRSECELLHMN